jgi:hypothetical protein
MAGIFLQTTSFVPDSCQSDYSVEEGGWKYFHASTGVLPAECILLSAMALEVGV